jgi:hypothetical protein
MALSTTTSTPTGWAADAAKSNWEFARAIAQQPFQPYQDNMLAGWNQGQSGGYNSVVNGAGVGQAAQALAQQGAQTAMAFQPGQVSAAGYNPAMQGVMNTHAANAGPATSWGVMNTHAASAGPAQQMAAAQMARGDVRDVQAGQFPGANLGAYMNPYTGAVIDTTLGQLGRQNDILQNQANARASAAGAFGGSRQAVMNAENNRNFMDTAGQVTSNLYNQNFSQAQQAIQADQNRALQAGGMNQQADLSVGQANLANRQASGLQNMLAGNSMNQFNAGLAQQAGMATSAAHNSAAAQQAANANQMAQYNAGLQQQAGMATSLAHNAALANQAAAQNRAGEFNATAAMRAQEANQQAGLTGAQTQLQAANALNGMGLDQQQQLLRGAEAQFNMGQARTAFDQSALDNVYNQWAAGQNYPMRQLGILQQGLNGYSSGETTVAPGQSSNRAANVLAGALGGGQLGYGLSGGLTGWAGLGAAAGGLAGLFG